MFKKDLKCVNCINLIIINYFLTITVAITTISASKAKTCLSASYNSK